MNNTDDLTVVGVSKLTGALFLTFESIDLKLISIQHLLNNLLWRMASTTWQNQHSQSLNKSINVFLLPILTTSHMQVPIVSQLDYCNGRMKSKLLKKT